MPWSSKVAGRTAQLRTAQAALSRFQTRAWSRKADNLPDFDRQQQRRQDRADLQAVVENLGPIVEARVEEAAKYDNECKAIASEAARPRAAESDGLPAFKVAVADVLATSPDHGTAQRRIQALLATEATRLALRNSK